MQKETQGTKKVSEIMTKKPVFITPDTDIRKVAKLMDENNVGEIPVIDNKDSRRVVGVVTDRDIAMRVVAAGRNPMEMNAGSVMSTPVVTVREDALISDVARLMQRNMIRRVPVVNEKDEICGMVAQADIALKSSDQTTADVVQHISKPTSSSSNVK
jgi:CBS domain-containing protein